MADIFQRLYQESQNNKDPFQRLYEANQRQSSKLAQVTLPVLQSAYTQDVSTSIPTDHGKSLGDYANDTAVGLAKTVVGVPQALVGVADLAGYGAEKAVQGYQEIGAVLGLNERPDAVQYTGHLGKALEDMGVGFKQTQDFLSDQYSDAYKSQQQGLHDSGEFSFDKSLNENLGVLGDKASYVLDNPALAYNTTLESLGYILGGGAIGRASKALDVANTVSRGAGAEILTLAAREAAARQAMSVPRGLAHAALGEGAISGGILQENIRNQSESGLTTTDQSNLALAAGLGVGTLGYGFGRVASRAGVQDVDSVLVNGVDPMGRVVKGAALEGLEEVPQENLENFAENLATGKGDGNILYGAADSTVLGFAAGALMGGATNSLGEVSTGASNLGNAVVNKVNQVKDKVTQVPLEDLSNPEHQDYNPTQAYKEYSKLAQSEDTELREQSINSMVKVVEDITTTRQEAQERFGNIFTALEEAKASDNPTLTSMIPELEQDLKTYADQYKQVNQQYLELQAFQEKLDTHARAKSGDIVTSQTTKANVDLLTQPTQDGVTTSEQQQAVDHVTKFFSQYDAEELNQLAEQSIYFTPEQKDSLRQLAVVKIQQNLAKDSSKVHKDILSGFKGNTVQESHRGLSDYETLISRGVRNQDIQLIESALGDLESFATNHSNKAEVLSQAFDMVKGTDQVVQVVPIQGGDWKINTDSSTFLKGKERNATGAIDVHRGSNSTKNNPIGLIDRVQQEAELISNTYSALDNYVTSFTDTSDSESTDASTEQLKNGWVRITTPVNQNTSLVEVKNDEKGLTQKEYRTSYNSAYTDSDGVTFTVQIRRDFNNPDLVTELTIINADDPLDIVNLGKIGIRTDDEILHELLEISGSQDYTAPTTPDTAIQDTQGVSESNEQKLSSEISQVENPVDISNGINTDTSMGTNQEVESVPTTNSNTSVSPETTSANSSEVVQSGEDTNQVTPTEVGANESVEETVVPPSVEPTQTSTSEMVETYQAVLTQNGMSSVSTQETPHVDESGNNKHEMTSFESGDEVKRSHSIPKGLVNQTKSLKDARQELTAMSTQDVDNSYGLDLLDKLTSATPDIQVKIVDDLNQESDPKLRVQLSAGGVFTPDNNTVNIYPNGDVWEGSATDLVNHELVHAVTFDAIDKGLTDEQIQVVDDVRDALEKHVQSNWETTDPHALERLDYAHRTDYPHELFSVLIAESDVRDALQGIVDLSKLDIVFNELLEAQSQKGSKDDRNKTTDGGRSKGNVQGDVSKSKPTGTASVSAISDGTGETGNNKSSDGLSQDSNATDTTLLQTEESKPTGVVPPLQGITKASRTQERSKPFRERNLVKAHFDQTKDTNNPLITVKDFISGLIGNLKESVQQYVKLPVSKIEVEQLKDFLNFNEELSKTVNSIFKLKGEYYRYQDYSSFLVNEQGKLDENIVSALSLAAYSTFIESGLNTLNTNDDLIKLLHLDEGTYIPSAIAKQYREVGQQRAVYIHALGKKAVQFLGLKGRRDSDPKFQSSLEGSLGGLVYMALRTQGLIEETSVSGQDHSANMKLIYEANDKKYTPPKELGHEYTYVRSTLATDGEVIPRIQEIVEANKETKGFLSRLFANDVGLRMPLLEQPNAFDQRVISRTSSVVSSTQAKLLEQAQKNGFKVRTAVAHVFQNLLNQEQDFLFGLMGINTDEATLNKLHISERDNFKAKAQNDQRALLNGLEFINGLEVKGGEYQTFWDTQYTSSNNRMYYNSNMFNVQTQQIHRSLAGLESFKSTFDPSESALNSEGKASSYGKFLRAIAENMEGVEDTSIIQKQLPTYQYRTVDKVPSQDFLPAFEAYLDQDYVQAAISAMSDLIYIEQENVGRAPPNMPESILNKRVQVKDVKRDLFKVSSGKLNQADRKHLNDLLNVFMQLDDSIYIGLYDDLSKIENTQVRKSVKGGALQDNSIQGERTIYIDLNNKEQADVFEILVHEYHHAVAHTSLMRELETNDKLVKVFDGIQSAIRGFGEDNESIDPYVQSRLQYMYNSDYSYSEILTVGTVEPSVIEVLQQIPFKEGSKHSLYDMVLNISHEMMRKQNPSKYTKQVEDAFNDLEQNRRTDNQGSVEERTQLTESGGVSGATELQDSGRDQQGTGQESQKKSTKGSRRYSTVLNAKARKAIQDFVNEGGMGVQSLYALISLAEHHNALVSEAKEFTTYVGLSSDGVNSGVAIANVLAGLSSTNMRMQVGLIPLQENQQFKNYFDTKVQGVLDYYVEFAQVINKSWGELKSQLNPTGVSALESLFTSWGKRKMAKVWAVPFNYNAGFTRLKSVMAEQFISDIYSQMTKIANIAIGLDTNSIEYASALNLRDTLQTNLTEVLGFHIKLPAPELLNDWDFGMQPNGEIDYGVNRRIQATLFQSAFSTFGEAAQQATTEFADNYMKSRDLSVAMHQAAFKISDFVKTKVRDKIIADMVKQGLIEEGGYESLSSEEQTKIDKELLEYAPVLTATLGSVSDNPLESGLSLTAKETRLNQDGLNQLQISHHNLKGDAKTQNIRVGTAERTEQSIDIGGLALQVQSVDAGVSATTIGNTQTINVHDANISGIENFEAMALEQNKAFFDRVGFYRSQAENVEMLLRTLQGVRDLAKEYDITKVEFGQVLKDVLGIVPEPKQYLDQDRQGLLTTLSKIGFNVNQRTGLSQVLDLLIDTTYQAEQNKVAMLKDTYAIQQYAGENGEFVLTDKEQSKLTQEAEALAKAQQQAHETNNKLEEEFTQAFEGKFDKSKQVEFSSTKLTPLQSWFEQRIDNPISVIELLGFIENGQVSSKEAVILQSIKKLLPDNLFINYFGANQVPPQVNTDGVKLADVHAWYDLETNTVNIKSMASKGSKVDSSTVIHELLHAALAQRVQTVRANSTAYSEAQAAIDNLEELRQELLTRYADNPTVQGMLENLDEFISYGLTEPKLQQLMQAVMVDRGTRSKSKLKSMLQDFVDALASILGFRGKKIHALAAFVHDTAVLIQSLEPIKPEPSIGMLFSQHNLDTLEVFQQLDSSSNSVEHSTHLDNVVNFTLSNLYRNDDQAKQQIDQIGISTTSDAIAAGFSVSTKEDYIQQAVKLVMDAYLDSHSGTLIMSQVRKSFDAAYKKLSPKDLHKGDWTTATEDQQDLAQSKWDYLFNTKGNPDFLSRFMSMALTNEELRQVLNFQVEETKAKGTSVFDRLLSIYHYAVSWLSDKYARLNPSNSLSQRVNKLTEQLTRLDIKARQHSETWHIYVWNLLGKVTSPLNQATGTTAQFLFDRPMIKNSRYKAVRVLGKIASLTPTKISQDLPERIAEIRNRYKPNERLGSVMELMTEVSAPSALRNIFDGLVRRGNQSQQYRQSVADGYRKAILESFTDAGKHLTKEDHKAVTYSLLRTDVQSLIEQYGIDEIVNLIQDNKLRNNEVTELEQQVLTNPNGNDMLIRAKQLAYYMITNSGGEGLVKNTVAIASGIDTAYQGAIVERTDPLAKQLDTLISLYALGYVPSEQMQVTQRLVQTEAEGLKQLIQLHSELVKEGYADFEKNPLAYTKGYMPELVNPYREIAIATSQVERKLMEKEGWEFISTLAQDPNDQVSERHLMIHSDRGYQRVVSGAVDLLNTARKGTEVISRSNPQFVQVSKMRSRAASRRANQNYKTYDPSQQQSSLIASYDVDGLVLAYNYEMSGFVRDTYLERNHNFADLLGSFAGTNAYKPLNETQHIEVVEVLFKDYKDNYIKNPDAYVSLSPQSTDPKIIEMWRMLPHDFRQEAMNVFGKNKPIIIRNDILNIAFGFKKYSVAQMFDKLSGEQNTLEKIFTGMAYSLFGNTAQAKVAKIEHIVQEIVRLAKDIIVIRSVSVLWGNILSNGLMLLAQGISPVQMGKDFALALYNARKYQKAKDQIVHLEAQLRMGGNTDQIEQEIAKLQDEVVRNPLSEFISAGMLSSIVEDVAIQQGDYTYTSEFKQKVQEYTKWIPSPAKTAAEWLMVSPSTAPYQFLATTTQLSDFIAKYSLYNHLRRQGKSFEEATSEASQTFINYDMPTSRTMQYMNDVGLFMFTKFFLRFQAVLMKQLEKRAASVIGQHMAVEMFTNSAGILDPLAINRLGNNPLEGSVFNLPSALGELPVVNAAF